MALTPKQVADFQREGYVIVRNFFSDAEIARLYAIATGDEAMFQHAFGTVDKSGKPTRLTLWYTPGDDVYGLLTRSQRMVGSVAG
jgi:phytanoyl-CoA hydroxylase